jgi:hypothetical protein
MFSHIRWQRRPYRMPKPVGADPGNASLRKRALDPGFENRAEVQRLCPFLAMRRENEILGLVVFAL